MFYLTSRLYDLEVRGSRPSSSASKGRLGSCQGYCYSPPPFTSPLPPPTRTHWNTSPSHGYPPPPRSVARYAWQLLVAMTTLSGERFRGSRSTTQLKLEPRPPIHSVSAQREFSMINCEKIVFLSSVEVIQDRFALLCGIIGPENSRHFVNQSNSQLKTITICHSRFPALQAVCVFT